MVMPPSHQEQSHDSEAMFLNTSLPVTAKKSSPIIDNHTCIDFDILRELRCELQDLQVILQKVKLGENSMESSAPYIMKTMADIEPLMSTISEKKFPGCGDSIRHFHNLWEQMSTCPLLSHPEKQYSPQDQTCYFNSLERIFKDLVFNIGYMTIPSRINDWLMNSQKGFYIPFHDTFADELPDEEDRKKILNILYYQPKLIKGGLVEPDSGLIYRYSLDKRERRFNYLFLGIAILIAIGIVVGSAYLPVSGWPLKPTDLPVLLIGWFAVVIGTGVHLAVTSAKKMQSKKSRPPIMAMSQIPLLLDAKLGFILLKILLTLVGFLGLVFAAGIDNTKPFTAFFVGYSLDSVVDLFSASLEQKASAQITALKQKTGTAP